MVAPLLIFHLKESPELAFLTLSIPFFCIENLDVKIEMKNFQGNALWNDLKEFHKKEAIRFLRANNALIISNYLKFLKIKKGSKIFPIRMLKLSELTL